MRVSTSRPSWSVPSQYCAEGGESDASAISSGSCTESQGAASASAIDSSTIAPPMTSGKFQRSRDRTRARTSPSPATDSSACSGGRSAASIMVGCASAMLLDPRIEHVIAEIDHDVDQYHERGDHQHCGLHLRVVAVIDGIEHELTDTGQAEHLLDHDRAGNEVRGGDADRGHH